MAYADRNFKTKKALKDAVASGDSIGIFNVFFGSAPNNGVVSLEGPHYPAPHTWYATATVVDSIITKVN
jgi:hypothetical protein